MGASEQPRSTGQCLRLVVLLCLPVLLSALLLAGLSACAHAKSEAAPGPSIELSPDPAEYWEIQNLFDRDQIAAHHITPIPQAVAHAHVGFFHDGRPAFAFRRSETGFDGRLMMWHPEGPLRSLALYRDGVRGFSWTWDLEGRQVHADYGFITKPWNPGPTASVPPSPALVEEWLEELLTVGDLHSIP